MLEGNKITGFLTDIDLKEITHRFGDDMAKECLYLTHNRAHDLTKIAALGSWPAFVIEDMLRKTEYRWDKDIPENISYTTYVAQRQDYTVFDNAKSIIEESKTETDIRLSLKPCPFCGGKAKLYSECEMVKVVCSEYQCQCSTTAWFDEAEDAIKAWNRRE